MSQPEFEIKLKKYQDDFIFDDKPVHFLKSAWGTGKSTALIIALNREAEMYPDNLLMCVRKEFVDLRDSTMKDFTLYTGRKIDSNKNCTYANGSVIMFRHAEEITGNNLQNVNLGSIFLEQGEEFETDEAFFTLFGRLRRKDSSGKAYVISNAKGHNWIYKLKQKGIYDSIADPDHKNRLDVHFSATTYDNSENLPPRFFTLINTLKESKPNLYNRLVLNSDEEEDTVDIIIQPEWVREAQKREIRKSLPCYRVVACDPARYGDDETVIYCVEKYGKFVHIRDFEVYSQKSTMETAGRLVAFKKKHYANLIAIDICGLGAGIADRLEELQENVMGLNSASASAAKERYKNLRSEMWETAAKMFQDGVVCMKDCDDEILADQLGIVKYKTIESNGRLQVQAKEDIKKVIGRSPDRADCLVYGLYALGSADPIELSAYDKEDNTQYHFNPATC